MKNQTVNQTCNNQLEMYLSGDAEYTDWFCGVPMVYTDSNRPKFLKGIKDHNIESEFSALITSEVSASQFTGKKYLFIDALRAEDSALQSIYEAIESGASNPRMIVVINTEKSDVEYVEKLLNA